MKYLWQNFGVPLLGPFWYGYHWKLLMVSHSRALDQKCSLMTVLNQRFATQTDTEHIILLLPKIVEVKSWNFIWRNFFIFFLQVKWWNLEISNVCLVKVCPPIAIPLKRANLSSNLTWNSPNQSILQLFQSLKNSCQQSKYTIFSQKFPLELLKTLISSLLSTQLLVGKLCKYN